MSHHTIFEPTIKLPNDLWQDLGITARGPELYEAIHRGLHFGIYDHLAHATGLSKQDLAKVVDIAPATLQRRSKAGRFNKDESDRFYRLAHLLDSAVELFEGDADGARRWIASPVKGLGGVRPVDMIATYAQTEAVFDLIGRLEHGVFA